MVATTQLELPSMSTLRQDSTQHPIDVEPVPDQCHRLVADKPCPDILPITQQEDTPRINNITNNNRTGVSTLTKARLEFRDLHYDHDVASCQVISKAIDLQQAGLDLNFALPIHSYMPDKSQFDQWIKVMAK